MSGDTPLKEFFTRPPLPPTGLSIHRRSVAVAATRWVKGKLHIHRAAVEPLPAGVLEPTFEAVNIKNREALSDAIRRALKHAKLERRKRWCLAIPSAACRLFSLDLEEVPADARELAQILQWKAERFLGTAASELTLGGQRIISGPSGGRYLVVAVRTDVLTAYESILTGLGLRPGWVVPAAIAEIGWLIPNGTHGDALLVSYEDEVATFLFTRGDAVLAVRSISCSPEMLLDEVHRTLAYYQDKLSALADDSTRRKGGWSSVWPAFFSRRHRSPEAQTSDVAAQPVSPEPQLQRIVLIAHTFAEDEQAHAVPRASLRSQVKSLCREFFPDERAPDVYCLDDEKVEEGSPLALSAIAAAAGITSVG